LGIHKLAFVAILAWTGVDLDADAGHFGEKGELFFVVFGRLGVMGNDRHDRGLVVGAYTPDMKVRNLA
jgi:hypothetical protein